MEQSLLDSSKYRIHSVSVDSRFADQCSSSAGYDTADFMIRMPTAFKNIQRIALSSAEVPFVEYLFSTRHGNLNFAVTIGGTTTTGTIGAGNYTDSGLVDALQAALQVINPGFTCTLNTVTGLITISNTVTAFEFSGVSDNLTIASRCTHWGLGYYLGFRSKATLASTAGPAPYTLTATSVILVQPTTYYLLQLGYPDQIQNITHCVANHGSVPAFAKLVLRENIYAIQFNDNADYLRKEYTFLAPVNVTQLRARLVDPFGCTVDMRCMDWSFTVELYEVVNSRTYAHMGLTYER
jgi:hypothetical protein